MAGTQKKKGGNKHSSNLRRVERKYKRKSPKVSPSGNCGSSFCTKATGCDPWK